jgi:hypothetical protein
VQISRFSLRSDYRISFDFIGSTVRLSITGSHVTGGSCQLRGAVRSGFFASVEDKSMASTLPAGDLEASGYETIVMNRKALKNSDQNGSQ